MVVAARLDWIDPVPAQWATAGTRRLSDALLLGAHVALAALLFLWAVAGGRSRLARGFGLGSDLALEGRLSRFSYLILGLLSSFTAWAIDL